MYYNIKACQHGGLQHGRSLEHCILLSVDVWEEELLCAPYSLVCSEKFITMLYFELNDSSPKTKYHIVDMRRVNTLYISCHIERPDFSKPHPDRAVARHMTRLATPI